MTEPQTHPHVREHTVVVPADVPMVALLGPRDELLRTMERQFPRVDLHVRGNEFHVSGPSAEVALVERHAGTGRVQVCFVQGFGFDVPCAIASSVAHDSHHILVVGTDEAQMAQAVNALADCDGGMLVVRDGVVRAQVELPIAGLMSNEPAPIVAAKAEAVLAEYRACGCRLHNANMQLSLLALVVIPELRISDLGLVDVQQFRRIDVVS